MYRNLLLTCLIFMMLACGVVYSDKMPREDVVVVPAIQDSLCVSNVFQTNMVIQRDKPVKVWGWAASGEEITVSFAGQSAGTKAKADRSWEVTLKAMPANSTAQEMTVKGKSETLKLENILIGDVWVLGGQSNMEFPIHKVDDGQFEIASANFPEVRLLNMPWGKGFDSVNSFDRLYEWSSWFGRHFKKGNWDVCSPDTVREFTAIGYIFGRRLQMATQVPIGLINTSIGGTTVETWTPEEVLEGIKGHETQQKLQEWKEKISNYDAQEDLQKRIANFENRNKRLIEQGKEVPADRKAPTDLLPGPAADKNRPGYCFASVIKPLEGINVKGAVFHQGFNNCFEGSAGAKMYYQIFGKMITAWRSAFNDEKMPFCIISLCTAGDPQTREDFAEKMFDVGALIREAQYKTFRDFYDAGDKAVGFASSFDLRKSWYHPQIKVPAGERAAKWALVSQYGLLKGDDYWLPPSIKQVEIADGTIRLHMSTSVKIKDESTDTMTGFAIAGKDRVFYPAEISWYTDGSRDGRNRPVYKKDILTLSSPFVSEPVHFRHAWARNPMSNIVNSQCVPIATQRSDDWELEETPVKVDNFEQKNSRQIRNELIKMLRQADIERRYKEARMAVEELEPLVEKNKAKK